MSTALSDFNSNSERAQNVSRRNLYSDVPTSFQVHPILLDIRPVTDIDAVKASVRNLVVTNYMERLFQPHIGGNIYRLLFEPANVFTAISIQQEIEGVLSRHEPRVTDVTVEVFDDSDRNAYLINIGYRVTFRGDVTDSLSFYLSRLR